MSMPTRTVQYWLENKSQLKDAYNQRLTGYRSLLDLMTVEVQGILGLTGIKGVLKGRIKTFDAFYRKLLIKIQKGKIEDPFLSIRDIVALRVIVPFMEEITLIEAAIIEQFQACEIEKKARTRAIGEFGYDSVHLILGVPGEMLSRSGISGSMKCEIQIRTILQDAWAEVEHELVYKTLIDNVEDAIRKKMVALNATLSLADTIFQEIRDYQRKKYQDIQVRHNQLLDKVSPIPEKISGPVYREGFPPPSPIPRIGDYHEPINSGMNDLLVEAMNAHLENKLERAIELYTQILAVSPIHYIFNHRGLVYFALSDYEKAIDDFTHAIDLNSKDTRIYTNRGLAYRMLKNYSMALGDFEKSLELNPLWPDTFYGRALTYYDMGNVMAALDDCDRAISLRPNFKQVARFKQFLLNQMQD
jgi:putative GTP pyrophosphokinase